MKKVLVLDFGGQYNLLVARRVRECGVYCEIKPYTMSMDDIRAFGPAAIIFTGGPATVFEPNAPALDNAIFELGLPILGICYGQQLMIHQLGGACRRAEVREYGKVELTHDGTSLLFDGIEPTSICWMSHGVEVERLSPGFRAVAHTAGCAYAAIENAERKLYGVQFHPEVLHTVHGTEILKNFLYKVCGLAPEWSMANYVSEAIEEVRAKVGGGKVLLALSGGVDSAVAAALLYRAVGEQLTCIFVDHGLLRKNEGDEVEAAFQNWDINFVRVNAEERFLTRLKDVSDPDYSAFLAAQLERFLDENGVDRGKLLGVGVSLAGVISAESRSILFAPTLALRDVPFSQLLQAIPYPTRLENDGTCGGFAEWFSSPGTRNIAFLSIEDGVGGSVLVNGAQFTGDNGRSGEFGHMCVEPGGLPCKCGRRGCLEAYCSATRLTEVSGVTLREFFLGVECGNSAYRTLQDDYLRHLAIGIHNIRLALDCDVVLGGFMAKFLEPYLPQLRDQLAQLDPFDAAGAYLHLSRYPKHAALIGAALYFVKQFLDQV